jgi:hypothetical protein
MANPGGDSNPLRFRFEGQGHVLEMRFCSEIFTFVGAMIGAAILGPRSTLTLRGLKGPYANTPGFNCGAA